METKNNTFDVKKDFKKIKNQETLLMTWKTYSLVDQSSCFLVNFDQELVQIRTKTRRPSHRQEKENILKYHSSFSVLLSELCCHQIIHCNVTVESFSFTNPVLGHPLILFSMLDLLLIYSAELRSSLVFLTETMTIPSLIANVNCKDLNSPMVEQTHDRIRATVAKSSCRGIFSR